jgi:purine-nucleoside phosphorylase
MAVLLGSGLGGVCEAYPHEASLSFDDIPGVTRPEVAGHGGEVWRCSVGGRPCLFVRGRRHYYEAKTSEIGHLAGFLRALGVTKLLITSAAGSLQPTLPPGQLVLVEYVIDFQYRPLSSAPAAERGGIGPARPPNPRVLDLDPTLNDTLKRSAIAAGISLAPATLAACSGPAYETPAEVNALRSMAASVVSMSVAPELAQANSLGIQVACVAVITNWVTGIARSPLSHDDVLAAGRGVTDRLGRLITQFVSIV